MHELMQWKDIAPMFTEGILLGNGASVAIHDGFRYASLFDVAVQHERLGPAVAEIFRGFRATDFEYVLQQLWAASTVNAALGMPAGPVERAYREVRDALIAAVHQVHVPYEKAAPHLESIYRFLSRFGTVVSLNYDLILYWAAMLSRESLGNWFKDCFTHGTFRDNWQELRGHLHAEGSTLFFYPHGNLALTRNAAGNEGKVYAHGANLLETVQARWAGETAVPLFVCEGTAEDKRQAISRSPYLERVYREVIPQMGESLVIYGWAMGDQERHILEQLELSSCKRCAVSVWHGDPGYAPRAHERLTEIGIREVMFFDSRSPGCWNNPA